MAVVRLVSPNSVNPLPDDTLYAGERLTLVYQVHDDDPSVAPSITGIEFTMRKGLYGEPVRVSGVKGTDGLWSFEVTSSLTVNLQSGRYTYELWATLSGGQRVPLGRAGSVFIHTPVGRSGT